MTSTPPIVALAPMSPQSPAVPRQPIRTQQYSADSESEDEDVVAISAPVRKHRRITSDAPLLPSESDKAVELPPPSTFGSRLKAFRKRNVGMLLIALSQCFFAGMSAGVALMSQSEGTTVPTWELIFTRMFLTGLCCHIALRLQHDPNPLLGPPGVRALLVLRGVVGFFGLFGIYFALRFLPLSDAVAITFLAPIAAGLLAAVFIGETYRPIEALAGVVSLSGVILIAKPTAIFGASEPFLVNGREVTEHERVVAVGVALLGCLGAGSAYTVMRKIGHRASPLHSILYFSVYCVLLSLMGPIAFPKSQPIVLDLKPLFIVLLILVGLCGFLGQVFLTMGLAREKAGRGSLATFAQAPISMGFERLLFGRTMDPLSLLGTGIIISSAIFTLLSKSKSTPAIVADSAASARVARAASISGVHGEVVSETQDDLFSPRLQPDLEAARPPSTPTEPKPTFDPSRS